METSRSCPTKGAAPETVPEWSRPPPPRARGQPAALTDEQRRFAAEHHNLIYVFLRENSREAGEYYDIAALGFLGAVKRYLLKPELRQYAFSTIAFRAMRSSITSFHRAEAQRIESERRYLETQPCRQPDPFEELEARLLLHDLALVSSKEQYALASMRLQGYSIKEVALSQGMEAARVRKLLREMYRVYLQLYINK